MEIYTFTHIKLSRNVDIFRVSTQKDDQEKKNISSSTKANTVICNRSYMVAYDMAYSTMDLQRGSS